MNLNYLYYFNVLGQYQHYGKAAEELHITQSALNQTIAKLEEDLNVRLFEKRGRNIFLTRLGKEYWQQVNYALHSLDIAQENLILASKGIGGNINIGFTFVVGSIFFPALMHNFLQLPNHSNISFNTLQGDSPEIITAVKERKCDIGFGTYFRDIPELKFVPVFRQNIILAVTKDHPLSKLHTVTCKDLEPYPFIAFKKNHTLYNMAMQFFVSKHKFIHPTYEVKEETTLAGMVAANLGIGFIPDSSLLDSFDIVKLSVEGAPTSRYLYMCYLDEPYIQTPAAVSFIDFVQKNRDFSLR